MGGPGRLASSESTADHAWDFGRSLGDEKVVVIEANIDDMNPQFYDYVMERLLDLKIKEVFLTPVLMKKNRPATLLTVICPYEELPSITEFLLRETTTIGLRWHAEERSRAEREMVPLSTKHGTIPFKVARWKGRLVNISPEYEVCKQLSLKKKVPLKEVFEEARRVAIIFQQIERKKEGKVLLKTKQ